MSVEIFPVTQLPEIQAGDDIASLIADRTQLPGGDIVVVAQKVVSKAEGQFRVKDGKSRSRSLPPDRAVPGSSL